MMKTKALKIAELHVEHTETYERLHREIPHENLLGLLEGGYKMVRIHRHGTLLVMLVEHDEAAQQVSGPAVEAAALEWKHLTEPLFAKPWTDASLIFDFDASTFERTLE
jgi:L-rhamnose mutarotase